MFEPIAAEKFFLQAIVSEADPYYALLTEVRRISFSKVTKIVGSAQRRREGAVLQHGSFLLARSSRTPELAGLCDVADLSADPRDWSDRLAEWIGKAVGQHCEAVQIPDEIRVLAREREISRYRDRAWTGIR